MQLMRLQNAIMRRFIFNKCVEQHQLHVLVLSLWKQFNTFIKTLIYFSFSPKF